MSERNRFSIVGKVVNSKTKRGIKGLRVEAWDEDIFFDDSLGSIISDEEGAFRIEFTTHHFQEWFLDRKPDVYFIVKDDAHIWNTKGSVLWNAQQNTNVTIELDFEPSSDDSTEEMLVRGYVLWADDRKPYIKARVLVFDIPYLRSIPLLLGETSTNKYGYYEMVYTAEQSSRAKKKAFNLLVVVRDEKDTELAKSPIINGASSIEDVNLYVFGIDHGQTSEFENLVSVLSPLLQQVPQNELTADDVAFLAGETGLNARYINWLAESARRHIEANSIAQSAFYGLFRQNIPTTLTNLLEYEIAVLRSALEQSVKQSIIPWLTAQDLDEITHQLWLLKAHSPLEPTEQDQTYSLGDLLATVPLTLEKQRIVAELYLKYDSTMTDEFWTALHNRSELTDEHEINQIWYTLQLGVLTGNYLPLILELKREIPTDPSRQLLPFAEKTHADWETILTHEQSTGRPIGVPPTTPGADLPEKIHNYTHSLIQYFEKAVPTTVIAYRVAQDTSDNSPFKSTKADLNVFFSNNSAFDFKGIPVDVYLSVNREEKLRDVAAPDVLTAQLKSIQRVFNITPRFQEISTLLAGNLHSAQAIAYVGERKFVKQYAQPLGGSSRAFEVYQQAEHVNAMALTLYMRHSVAFNSPSPYVISGDRNRKAHANLPSVSVMDHLEVEEGEKPSVIASDLSTLFGSLNLCDCQHCMSLYSPAAYLVDNLKFLDDAKKEGSNPLQVLLMHRPDLEHIELTCENTNTPMPYVDLVNEILEADIVSRGFEIVEDGLDMGVVLDELNRGEIPESIRTVFAQNGYSLTDQASVRIDNKERNYLWIILDTGWAFWLDYAGSNEGFSVVAWPQTSWTKDELSANPEHIHATAYIKLSEAVYPWNLPLNLPVEEVRVYLGHLGVPRYELMETFFLGIPSARLADMAIAYEYLGLTKEEVNIITSVTTGATAGTTPTTGAWNFWGVKEKENNIKDLTDGTADNVTGDWNVVLQRVSIFLQQSGLSYKELLELLTTDFINPHVAVGGNRSVGIVATEGNPITTCSPSQLEIQVVIGDDDIITAWIKIHRFVRLWRKLGWTIRDFGKAITALKAIDLDDALLLKLSHIQRLHANLKVPVVNLLSWWATIDTANSIDYQTVGQPEVKSLYEQLFLNKASINPVDSAFELNETRNELSTPSTAANPITINAHASTVTAALGITDADLTLLLNFKPSISLQEVTKNIDGSGVEHTPDQKPVFVLNLGKISEPDNRFTIKFQESDDGSIYKNIPVKYLKGGKQPKVIDIKNDKPVIRISYLGTKKFLRVAVTEVKGTSPKLLMSSQVDLGRDELKFDNQLNLANLSSLFRISSLAKALKLSIRDWLAITKLTEIAPFATTESTLHFVEKVGVIRASGFSINELNYLLRHDFIPSSGVAPTEEAIAITLSEIRSGLQKIAAENKFIDDPKDPNGLTTDPSGELTRKKLALLNWDTAIIEQVVATLNDAVTYEAGLPELPAGVVLPNSTGIYEVTLATLPGGFAFPVELNGVAVYDEGNKKLKLARALTPPERDRLSTAAANSGDNPLIIAVNDLFKLQDKLHGTISFDSEAKRLRFTGVMTYTRLTRLNAASNNNDYHNALNQLYEAPRKFLARFMRIYSVGDFVTELTALPVKVQFSEVLKNKVYFDDAAKKLHFIGAMTEQERDKLLAFSSDLADANHTTYQDAVKTLFNLSNILMPKAGDAFLTTDDVKQIFIGGSIPADRFCLVLKKLLPHLRLRLSELGVEQWLGDSLKLDASMIDALLKKWVKSQIEPATKKIIADFIDDPVFTESNPNIKPSQNAFPRQFKAFCLLHKIALLIAKFKFTPQQLQWLFELDPKKHWLDLNTLPLQSTATAQTLFQGWEHLVDLSRLREALPLGEALLTDVFKAAHIDDTSIDALLEKLNKGAQWEMGSLKRLNGNSGFNFSVKDYQNEAALLRLSAAYTLLQKLGASAEQCLNLAKPALTLDDASNAKNLVRAKYDDAQWLEKAKALHDPLREKKRSAMVSYLVNNYNYRDANELYEHFLIDVEMSPCMMTTRIKQAISSVQLFMQRCLMNLEDGVSLTTEQAQEWAKWRKYYRVWEANRKVLLYPENWIEPELRDDKSPIFKDLENELLQSDLNAETAEDAFLHYLEKLDQVARLDIVGMYHQNEQETDILHVFGRTYAAPHIYFYRRLDKVWSAWEKVDIDIEGEHLIPVVWNRRLYLFWAIFTEKSEQPTKEQRAKDQDPNKYWEIKFAWSEYKNKRWSPKKVSKKSLNHKEYFYLPLEVPQEPPLYNLQKPQDFSFKTRILHSLAGEQLSIECYGTIVDGIRQETKLPNPPAIVNNQFFGILTPHLAFDLSKFKDMPQLTYLKCRFLLGNGKPNKVERAKIKMQVRDPSGTVLESIALNSNGIAYSTFGYTKVVHLYLVSDGYELASPVKEEGSWWMPFNAFAYLIAAHEAGVDAVSDALDTAGDNATANAISKAINEAEPGVIITAAVLLGPAAIPFIITAITVAITAVSTAMSTVYSKAFTDASVRLFGRGMTVRLRAIPPPPPIEQPPPVFKPAFDRMKGIGEFILDGCNRDIVPAQSSLLVPQRLEPIEGTEIQSMAMVDLNVFDAMGKSAVLAKTPGTFRLIGSHQAEHYTGTYISLPFFYQDDLHTYMVSLLPVSTNNIGFSAFYHPTVCDLVKSLNRFGVKGLLTLANQRLTDYAAAFGQYQPHTSKVSLDFPREDVDFAYGGSYSIYNWELFFHTPFLIAMQLSKNQRFEEAQKWFHYIFDPTTTDSGNPGIERFWRVQPFYEEAKHIQTLEALITDIRNSKELGDQIKEWQADPFKPHVIARLRHVAYMKAVVMRYIDNLIAWGDQLFRRDTIESINEATQRYILAAQILGRRPDSIPARAKAKMQTFRTLDDREALNDLSNAMVEIENFLPPSAAPISTQGTEGVPTMLFFCIPGNDKLLAYWDTVSDRLFKIRHCMNIEGVVRTLPIYEPPIDPALLVRAAAAGIDLNSVLSDLNTPLSHYRFAVMLQKATELCNDVKALGAALLSALEKRDAETLGLLRSSHEVDLLKAIREIKKQQIEEANNTLAGLRKYEDVVTTRQQYYQSREFMNTLEIGHMGLVTASLVPMAVQTGAEVAAAILHLIPNAKAGAPTTLGVTYGGANIASALQAFGSAAGTTASIMNTTASLSATLGGYQRRQEEWTHQADLATKELQQVQKQIAAAEIRLAIAERELENHDLQIENAKEVDEYMRYTKFTNQELYSWMIGKISSIYFQGYQLAYDVAKRAERSYRYELGLKDSNFIQFGYWDSLKKGLLSGEQLHHDLKRLDVSYLDMNKRELELTKHISLTQLDPYALIQFKQSGKCIVSLSEAVFDLDYPGHYMRRIKSVSISIPCVTGPYMTVNCTLTQLKSSMRHTTLINNGYARDVENDDSRFVDNFGAIQSIATSHARDDSGMFELNFRDERYLHFEGTGAISTWQFEMPMLYKQFDYTTISDVVLHLKYTARDGGGLLKGAAERKLKDRLNELVSKANANGLFMAVNLKQEFPSEWHRFIQEKSASLVIGKNLLPFFVQRSTPVIDSVTLLATTDLSKNGIKVTTDESGVSPVIIDIAWKAMGNHLYEGTPNKGSETLGITFDMGFTLSTSAVADMGELVILVKYSI